MSLISVENISIFHFPSELTNALSKKLKAKLNVYKGVYKINVLGY